MCGRGENKRESFFFDISERVGSGRFDFAVRPFHLLKLACGPHSTGLSLSESKKGASAKPLLLDLA
jgi:hypothetical protein